MKMKSSVRLAVCILGMSVFFTAGPVLAGEAAQTAEDAQTAAEGNAEVLKDGIYSAEFNTDSSMFHVNEAKEGRGILTVQDGEMTIHVSLVSKSILKLFAGTAQEAQKEGAVCLEPTTDRVTYSDGLSEEVYGFDIPVPALDEEFDVALIGKKGKWYDHKVSVTDPQPETENNTEVTAADLKLEDGSYRVEVVLEGGSGKASVESPAPLEILDGQALVSITFSSPYYDYVLVGDEKYTPINKDGNSVFQIPVTVFDTKIPVTADTTAMSTPHEIDYTLEFSSASIEKAGS